MEIAEEGSRCLCYETN